MGLPIPKEHLVQLRVQTFPPGPLMLRFASTCPGGVHSELEEVLSDPQSGLSLLGLPFR
jgi:hypothetical protein